MESLEFRPAGPGAPGVPPRGLAALAPGDPDREELTAELDNTRVQLDAMEESAG